MFKKISVAVLCMILLLQSLCICAGAVDDSGSPKHIPRIVSVIFDDSGSMENTYMPYSREHDLDRWAYASYAMQAFIAMMGEDDELFVTKLSANPVSKSLDLGDKADEIDAFKELSRGNEPGEGDFTSSTWNVVDAAAKNLVEAYKDHKTEAKYYLVVMADGNLDPKRDEKGEIIYKNPENKNEPLYPQNYSDELARVIGEIKPDLAGADFETIFFDMGNNVRINTPGVETISATNSANIVEGLKEVSATVMGRTELEKKQVSVNDGKVSFEIKYPALSITLFAQKSNVSFKNIEFPVYFDKKATSYRVDTNTVQCADDLREVSADKKQVPAGFVSNITNGTKSLPKGKYEIDLSKYNLGSGDIVVLVEPAVKIGCKYYVGSDEKEKTFDEIKENLRDGDEVTVKCGLYEMKEDGSLGEAISDKVLSPDYRLYVNDVLVTEKVRGENNAYKLTMSKDNSDKELKIEAVLDGYQPFVMRETFGNISDRIVVDVNAKLEDVNLTKPLWKEWTGKKGKISFKLSGKAEKSDLEGLEIKIDGFDGLKKGACAKLGDSIKLDGDKLIYIPAFTSDTPFSKIPDKFKVQLCDIDDGAVLSSVTVSKTSPAYKLEAKNELEGETLTLGFLESNKKGITFTLYADYENNGKFKKVEKNGCEDSVEITMENGILPGTFSAEGLTAEFIPSYDKNRDKDISVSDFISKELTVYAKADVDGVEVESEKIRFGFGSASYKIVVENEITEPFTLDSIKDNKKKVIFSIVADYENDGSYGELEEWDLSLYDDLKIDSAELPGKTETEYDRGGQAEGKSFMPKYDEHNNNGVPFTAVSGRTHTLTASHPEISGTVSADVEVLPPNYEVTVRKDGIELVDYFVGEKNTQGVEFLVERDNRVLTAEELEGLEPYNLTVDKAKRAIVLKATPKVAEDGTAYLLCVPEAKVFTSLFSIGLSKEVAITLGVGNDSATATVKYRVSAEMRLILLIAAIIIVCLLYISYCCCTLVRFYPGKYYVVTFERLSGNKYRINSLRPGSKLNRFKPLDFLRAIGGDFGNDDLRSHDEKELNDGFFTSVYKKLVRIRPYMEIVTERKSIGTYGVRFKSTKPIFRERGERLGSRPRLILTKSVIKDLKTVSLDENSLKSILKADPKFEKRFSLENIDEGSQVYLSSEMAVAYKNTQGNDLYLAFYVTTREYKNMKKNNN